MQYTKTIIDLLIHVDMYVYLDGGKIVWGGAESVCIDVDGEYSTLLDSSGYEQIKNQLRDDLMIIKNRA